MYKTGISKIQFAELNDPEKIKMVVYIVYTFH